MPQKQRLDKTLILYYLLKYTAYFTGVLPLLVLFSKKRAFVFSEPIIPFVWLTFIATLYELVGTTILRISVDYWFQVYSLLEFLTVFYFYGKLFQSRFKTLFRLFFIALVVVYGISFYFWMAYSSFIAVAINRIPLTLLVLLGSFWWVRDLFKSDETQNLWQNPTFYFVMAFYIYYLVTMPLFLMANFIFDSNLYFYDFAIVNVMATLILRILLTCGVWKMRPA